MAFKDITFQNIGKGVSNAGGWLKKKAGEKFEEYKKESQERAVYQKELAEEMKKARRQAYLKESVKQARLKAVRDAKAKFQPKQNPLLAPNPFMNGMLGGTPKKDNLKADLKKKMKKGSNSNFDDLIWKY